MDNSLLALLVFLGIVVALLAGIIIAMRSKNTTHSGSFASMVAMHDMMPKDKQKAVEIVMEQKEQKKWKEEESGDDYTDGTD
jgi:hypothetical protein